MPSKFLELFSNWIAAIGATIGAIGQTKQLAGKRYIGQQLWTMGKGTQAAGNAFQAVAEKKDPIAEMGNWLMSAGSTTVTVVAAEGIPTAYIKELRESKGLKNLDQKTIEEIEHRQVAIIGNSLQAIGAYIEASRREDPKRVIGGIIQSSGAITEALGLLVDLSSDEKTAQQLAVLGGWLQALGVSLQAVSVTEQFKSGE